MAFLALISGPMASGKTVVCTRLYKKLIEAGYPASGIVQETLRNKTGLPVSISFRHLSSGDLWQWTERDPARSPPVPFDFPEEPLVAAIDRLARDNTAGCFPIILDEIGLLEIRDGKGFLTWLLDYLRQPDSCLVASLRAGREEGLLEFLDKAGLHRECLVIKVFQVEEKNRESCFASVSNWVFRHCPKGIGKLYLK